MWIVDSFMQLYIYIYDMDAYGCGRLTGTCRVSPEVDDIPLGGSGRFNYGSNKNKLVLINISLINVFKF